MNSYELRLALNAVGMDRGPAGSWGQICSPSSPAIHKAHTSVAHSWQEMGDPERGPKGRILCVGGGGH